MNVWRLCHEEYTDLSGIGANLYGGRWNSPGHAVVYATSSLALAFVEIIPALRKNVIPKSYVSLYINIDDDVSKKEIKQNDFPSDWRKEKTRNWFLETGDQWIKERKELLLIVPSVIIPEEKNILINPHHPEITKVATQTIKPFTVDPRFIS
jgi:RES domain-containing protein